MAVKLRAVVLAWNEAEPIRSTLEGLFSQRMFRDFDVSVDVVVNGSTDGTAAAARDTLESLGVSRDRGRVHDLALADKANAWNFAVHALDRDSDHVVFLDADIAIADDRVCGDLVATLERDPTASVACAPIGTTRSGGNFERVEPISMRGALYAVRSAVLREAWIPLGIIHDDAYLARWFMRDGLRIPADDEAGLLARGRLVYGLDRLGAVIGGHDKDRGLDYLVRCRVRGLIGDVHTRIFDAVVAEWPPAERARRIGAACQLDPWWFLREVDARIARYRVSARDVEIEASSPSRSLVLKGLAPFMSWRANRLMRPGRSWRAAWDGHGSNQPRTGADLDLWAPSMSG